MSFDHTASEYFNIMELQKKAPYFPNCINNWTKDKGLFRMIFVTKLRVEIDGLWYAIPHGEMEMFEADSSFNEVKKALEYEVAKNRFLERAYQTLVMMRRNSTNTYPNEDFLDLCQESEIVRVNKLVNPTRFRRDG